MNVKIEDIPEGTNGEGKTVMRKGLVVTKDIEEGDVIFVEEPIVSALNTKLEVIDNLYNGGQCAIRYIDMFGSE
jgi:hypothetical protein